MLGRSKTLILKLFNFVLGNFLAEQQWALSLTVQISPSHSQRRRLLRI